jgi:hypothetical protein
MKVRKHHYYPTISRCAFYQLFCMTVKLSILSQNHRARKLRPWSESKSTNPVIYVFNAISRTLQIPVRIFSLGKGYNLRMMRNLRVSAVSWDVAPYNRQKHTAPISRVVEAVHFSETSVTFCQTTLRLFVQVVLFTSANVAKYSDYSNIKLWIQNIPQYGIS